ncbi:MAG: glycosyltransferase family 2 protein [Lachnospiraceae bacterium]|nr:glycosyltransferase family 2 protein [Lachnospiraceae bacterium]MDD7627492.1 glycosyltransferase family 2 protein [Lachnospiraceae bacterium]MDY4118316.1 glycosyltransferase family 2 protein [Lachnospiraceae bacterium]
MGNPMVSIIVPVYNGEKSIERCLRSIQNQSYTNIEVIVVNDGSTDHTEKVIKKYVEEDARFHYIKKDNTGVSDSRNIGMASAKGEYFQFVDGDDWLVKRATEEFVRTAQLYDCDMVISDFYRVCGRKIMVKGHIDMGPVITRTKFAEYMMKAPANFYYGVLWNKFFKADIIRKFSLVCDTDLDWCEDFRFNLEYLQYVGNVGVIDRPLYYYVKTKGSLVDTQAGSLQLTIKTKRKLFDYYKELYQALDLYEENKLKIQMFYLSFAHDKSKKTKTA